MSDLFRIPPDLRIGRAAAALPLAGEVNWGMEAFGVKALRSITDGTGQIVGVIDTGVDRTHPLLASQVIDAKDFTGSPHGAADRHGHGTHVSGTAAGADPRIGVACGAKIVHGKGLSDGGSGSGAGIAAAMRWCYEKGARVLSMSLGSSGPDPAINAAGEELAAKGCWIVAAAGNSGGGTPDVDFPGRFPWAISVAALNRDLSPASFTNRGAKIDTAGPGVGIWSARPGGGYQEMSGTSMATPFDAGVLVLVRAGLELRGRPVPPVEEVRAILARRSTDTYTPGDDLRTGPGWLSPLLLALALVDDPPPVRP